jgi:hypothetical protein
MKKSKRFPYGDVLHLIGKVSINGRTLYVYDNVDANGDWNLFARVVDRIPGLPSAKVHPMHYLKWTKLTKQVQANLINSGVPREVVEGDVASLQLPDVKEPKEEHQKGELGNHCQFPNGTMDGKDIACDRPALANIQGWWFCDLHAGMVERGCLNHVHTDGSTVRETMQKIGRTNDGNSQPSKGVRK